MTPRRHDNRFFALLDLAKAGDESAVADLWSEYGHDYRSAGDPRDQLPTRKNETRNNTPKEH